MKKTVHAYALCLTLFAIGSAHAQVHLITTDSLLDTITTTVTEWQQTRTTEEHLAYIIDGNKQTDSPWGHQIHPMNANGRDITFAWRETYTQGEFKFFNRTDCCNDRILNSTVEYILDTTVQAIDTITTDVGTITLTLNASLVFNKIKLVFSNGTGNSSHNFREIEVRGSLLPPTVESDSSNVSVGNTTQLNVNNISSSAMTWTSLDPSIATVNAEGVVTGVDTGSVLITAALKRNSALVDTSTVVVTPASTSILISTKNQIRDATVYHLDGTKITTFPIHNDSKLAIHSLPLKTGVYLVRYNTGEIEKMLLEQ